VSENVRAIREGEYEECLALWDAVWPEDGRAYFARYFFGDANFQPEYVRVCIVDGRIVSAAQIVKRIVSCGDFTLTMGGIANVATLPEYRRRGYSRACLRQAVEVMESDAMDFSLLFTGTHALYEGLGWERDPSTCFEAKLRPHIQVPPPALRIREYATRDDAAIHAIYGEYNDSRPGAVRRSAAYWRDWIGLSEGRFHSRAIVAESEGAVCGYCLYRLDGPASTLEVFEFGVMPPATGVVAALLGHAAVEAQSAGIREVSLPLHENPEVARTERWLFESGEVQSADSPMVRFLHRDSLLSGLAPELTMRWMEAGSPPGSLLFTGPYGAARIGAVGGFLRVEEVEESGGALGQADLFRMLTGRGLPASLSEIERRFAEALFPPQEAWFWELDGF